MDSEEKELLKKSVALGQENQHILRSLQRSLRLSRLMSLVYWVFIIGSAVGAYYLVQPYIDSITGAYGGAKSSFGDFKGMIDSFRNATK